MKSYENKIRSKAILVYLIIAVISAVVAVYIYDLSRNVSQPKSGIESQYEMLRFTNQVVLSVSETQSAANLYIASNNRKYLEAFQEKIVETRALVDSLQRISLETGDTANIPVLHQIDSLLDGKKTLIERLSVEMRSYESIDTLANSLVFLEYPFVVRDSITISTVVSDSLPGTSRELDFWDRFSSAFSPDRNRDSVPMIQKVKTDTLAHVRHDSVEVAQATRRYVQKLKSGYSSRLNAISRQLSVLLLNDQEISAQMIGLIEGFHQKIIRAAIESMESTEAVIQRNYRMSVIGIGISLVVILIFIILIIIDANKGLRARKALEEANERIKEVMESRHRLLLSISHDIKTPLNSLTGYAHLWRQGKAVEQEDIASVENSAGHINALVNNLLEYSSLEQGKATVSPAPCDPVSFFSSVADMFSPLTRRKGLLLETAYDFPRGAEMVTDELKLKQIVINVVSNAVKYTACGKVTLTACYCDGQLQVTVEDTGVGIPESEQEKIFMPFTRVEGNNAMASGHGMGLFVVRGLVSLLEGRIELKSEPGKGTAVEITIPVLLQEKNAENPPVAPGPAGGLRLLVVDDDPSLLRLVDELLARMGHRPETVTDIAAVTDLGSYDAVITDMEMGATSGIEVLKAVKSRFGSIPVYIMTGRHEYNGEEAAKHGFDGFLRKPFGPAELEALLGGSGARARSAESESFATIEELFEGDSETLKTVVSTFVETLTEDMRMLRGCLFNRDFPPVREICHRILPMFVQFGAESCIPILREIDGMKGLKAVDKKTWTAISVLLTDMELFIGELKSRYGID